MSSFIKIDTSLFQHPELNINDIILLSLVISYSNNNQQFYYTDKQLIKYFNDKLGTSVSSIQRIITKLSNTGFIITQTVKQLHPDKKWGNRRTIILGHKLTTSLSSTKKEDITDTIIPQPIQDIQKEVKVSKIKEKVGDIIKFNDNHFPEEYKQDTYTQEEYNEIDSFIKGNVYNYTPKEKKPHQDNIFNSTIEF